MQETHSQDQGRPCLTTFSRGDAGRSGRSSVATHLLGDMQRSWRHRAHVLVDVESG